MFDKVTITYRGAKYEIGRGRDFYGIWTTGGPRSQPLERWPETPEGWSAAWTRFASIEAPGAIVPVGRRTPPVGPSAVRVHENPDPFGQNTAPPGETAAETIVVAGTSTAPYGQFLGPHGQNTAPNGPRRRCRVGGQREDGRDRRGSAARRGRHPGGGWAFPGIPRRVQPRPAVRPAHPACHLPRHLDGGRRAHPPRRRPPAAGSPAQPGTERGHLRPVLRGCGYGHRRRREHGRRGPRARPRGLARLCGGIGGGLPAPAGGIAGPGRAAALAGAAARG